MCMCCDAFACALSLGIPRPCVQIWYALSGMDAAVQLVCKSVCVLCLAPAPLCFGAVCPAAGLFLCIYTGPCSYGRGHARRQ